MERDGIVGAAGTVVPVLRGGHLRGAPARNSPGLGVLRAGAERGRGAAVVLRERAAGTEWAGHTVDVLLRVYAKCISGRQEAAKRRIFDATRPLKTPEPPSLSEPEP